MHSDNLYLDEGTEPPNPLLVMAILAVLVGLVIWFFG